MDDILLNFLPTNNNTCTHKYIPCMYDRTKYTIVNAKVHTAAYSGTQKLHGLSTYISQCRFLHVLRYLHTVSHKLLFNSAKINTCQIHKPFKALKVVPAYNASLKVLVPAYNASLKVLVPAYNASLKVLVPAYNASLKVCTGECGVIGSSRHKGTYPWQPDIQAKRLIITTLF